MHLRLSLPQLDAIVQLAKHGSFRDAAAACGVSQPSFSRTIQTIETRVGARLFDRDTRRVSVTPAGQRLLSFAMAILHDYDSAFRDFEQFVAGRAGMIRIAVLPSVAATFLPRAMAAFRENHPTIAFELREDVGAPIHQAVKDGTVDFGIAPPPRDEELAFRPLLQDELMLVARAGHPLLDCAVQDWAVFADRPSIWLSTDTGLRSLIDDALIAAKVQAEPLFICKYPATLAAFVAEGMGISALTRLTLAQIANPAVGAVPLGSPSVTRPIGIVTHVRRAQSPATRMFLRELHTHARGFQKEQMTVSPIC